VRYALRSSGKDGAMEEIGDMQKSIEDKPKGIDDRHRGQRNDHKDSGR